MPAIDALPHIDHLVWDDWNRAHVAQHAVAPEEAEAAIAGDPLVRLTYKHRLVFIGPTFGGRLLTVVAGPVPNEPGVYYWVFSARPASRQERADYQQQKGGSSS